MHSLSILGVICYDREVDRCHIFGRAVLGQGNRVPIIMCGVCPLFDKDLEPAEMDVWVKGCWVLSICVSSFHVLLEEILPKEQTEFFGRVTVDIGSVRIMD